MISFSISGSIDGYDKRNDYVKLVTDISSEAMYVKDDYDYLISDSLKSDAPKIKEAISKNIPIVSSSKFLEIITKKNKVTDTNKPIQIKTRNIQKKQDKIIFSINELNLSEISIMKYLFY